MSDVELDLISKVVKTGDFRTFLMEGVTKEFFTKTPEYYEFLVKHFDKYKKVPGKLVFEKEFDIELPTVSEPIIFYIDEIKKEYKKGKVYELLVKANEVFETSPEKVIEFFDGTVRDLYRGSSSGAVNIGTTGKKRLKSYEELWQRGGIVGLEYPHATMNRLTMGLKQGELITVVAPPKSGKTYFVLNILYHLWVNNPKLKILIRSEEMTEFEISLRFDAIATKIDTEKIQSGAMTKEEKKRFFSHFKKKYSDMFVVEPSLNSRLENIRGDIEKYQPDIVFVDSSYKVSSGHKESGGWEDIQGTVAGLKKYAMYYKIPIINTTHFNKKALGKQQQANPSMEPVSYLSYLKESDFIVALHSTDEDKKSKINRATAIGSRSTRLLGYKFNWDFTHMNFSELTGTDFSANIEETKIEDD